MTKVRIDSKDPRVLYLEWTNETDRPCAALPSHAILMNLPRKPSDGFRDFRLFMVTRRSIVNPDEVCKLKIVLPKPVSEYPDDAYLKLEHYATVRTFNFNPSAAIAPARRLG